MEQYEINPTKQMPLEVSKGLVLVIERYMPHPPAEVKEIMSDEDLDMLQKRDDLLAFMKLAIQTQLDPITIPDHHLDMFRLSQAICLECVGGFSTELAASIYGVLSNIDHWDKNEKK